MVPLIANSGHSSTPPKLRFQIGKANGTSGLTTNLEAQGKMTVWRVKEPRLHMTHLKSAWPKTLASLREWLHRCEKKQIPTAHLKFNRQQAMFLPESLS
ncbi:uncharacterized protein CTRU02_215344 [Colletotrichum truncatum]|uniref:Uncharacterized protein n=1 Tax=Colletotrichum truncatum TaxID=5467 RepID=A0ACC3YD71_COLTU